MSETRRGYVPAVRLYPDVPGRRARALLHDGLVLLLLALFAWLALKVHDTVDKLSVLGSGVKEVGDHIPFVGGPVSDLGSRGEDSVHNTANLLGWITFSVPSLLVLTRFLPERVTEVRRLNAAARVLRDPLEPERRRALAMRAAFSLPYGQLLRYTRDPLGDLAAERYEPLVDAALEDAGLRRLTS